MRTLYGLSTLIFSALISGCLSQNQPLQNPDSSELEDHYIHKLVAMGANLEDIERSGDDYVVQGDMIFSKQTLDNWKTDSIQALGKRQQSRWDVSGSSLDIKRLDKTTIWVFIENSGAEAVGPNWKAAVLQAFNNWNAIPGSSVKFIQSPVAGYYHFRIFAGTTGPTGNLVCGQVHMSATSSIEPGVVYLRLNKQMEPSSPNGPNGLAHIYKTSCAMHELGHVLNITHTDEEGVGYSNNLGSQGPARNISGTPNTDAGSIFNALISISPTFTENDRRAIQQLYPSDATRVLCHNGGLREFGLLFYGVTNYQSEGDTLVALQANGVIQRRIGKSDAAFSQIWPGTGSNGTAQKIILNGGFLGVKTTAGALYILRPGSNTWEEHFGAPWVADFRISGERLVFLATDNNLYSKYIISNPNWVHEAGGGITDFALREPRLAIVQNGQVKAKDFANSFVTLYSGGVAEKVYLSKHPNHHHYIAFYGTVPGGGSYKFVGTFLGLDPSTLTIRLSDVANPGDVHLCGDRLAALKQGSLLYTFNLQTGAYYYHPSASGTITTDVELSGPNCEFLSKIDASSPGGPSFLYGKYGIDFGTSFEQYPNHSSVQGNPVSFRGR